MLANSLLVFQEHAVKKDENSLERRPDLNRYIRRMIFGDGRIGREQTRDYYPKWTDQRYISTRYYSSSHAPQRLSRHPSHLYVGCVSHGASGWWNVLFLDSSCTSSRVVTFLESPKYLAATKHKPPNYSTQKSLSYHWRMWWSSAFDSVQRCSRQNVQHIYLHCRWACNDCYRSQFTCFVLPSYSCLCHWSFFSIDMLTKRVRNRIRIDLSSDKGNCTSESTSLSSGRRDPGRFPCSQSLIEGPTRK